MPNVVWCDDGRKVVLVGQAPSRGGDTLRPFFGKSGGRLERLAGIPRGLLGDHFALANILQRWRGSAGSKGDMFPIVMASRAAEELLRQLDGRRVVVLGRAAARAMGVPGVAPAMTWRNHVPLEEIAVMPHPSGVSLWWNDPANILAAAAFLGALKCAG